MNLNNKFSLFINSTMLIGLCACNPFSANPTIIPSAVKPTSTHATPTPAATDIQLPSDPAGSSSEYCKPPDALLPVEDGNDISEDEIVHKLLDMWLRRYSSPNAHPDCRIDGYAIDRVYYDLDVISQSLEPRGDFMRVVDFSVKLIPDSNEWMGFSGDPDQSNWLHLHQVVAAIKTDQGYLVKFAYPQ